MHDANLILFNKLLQNKTGCRYDLREKKAMLLHTVVSPHLLLHVYDEIEESGINYLDNIAVNIDQIHLDRCVIFYHSSIKKIC